MIPPVTLRAKTKSKRDTVTIGSTQNTVDQVLHTTSTRGLLR